MARRARQSAFQRKLLFIIIVLQYGINLRLYTNFQFMSSIHPTLPIHLLNMLIMHFSKQSTPAPKVKRLPVPWYKALHPLPQSVYLSISIHISLNVSKLDSEELTYLSGSTFITGIASLNFMSFFPMFRQFLTGSMRRLSP
jgi:hypothetical protein